MHEKTYGCKPVNVNIRKDVKRCKNGKTLDLQCRRFVVLPLRSIVITVKLLCTVRVMPRSLGEVKVFYFK